MKVIIDGNVYQAATIDTLSIKHALQFDRECREHGYPISWRDVERVRAEMSVLTTDDERQEHPDALLLTAVTVWASRIAAGDAVTFDEVISAPLGSMRFVLDADELAASKGEKAATPDPHRARPGSGRAAAPARKRKSSPRPT